MQTMAKHAAIRLTEGKTKITVVDPVMAGGVVNPILPNSKWVPIKPTADGALGMALIRWMIENKKYNELFLSSSTLEAAKKNGYNGWSNAAHLVIADPAHANNGKMLRASDIGIEVEKDEKNPFIVVEKSKTEPVLIKDVELADIYFEGSIRGANQEQIKVKTAFLMLKESAYLQTLDEYSNDCGIAIDTIIEIAQDLTSHGTKVAVEALGGTATANGLNLSYALTVVSTLIGSMNRKGGNIQRRYSYTSIADGARYKLNTIEGKPASKGLRISRTGIAYETTDEYKQKVANKVNPYPSKLPWHPIGSASDNQMLFSVINEYPYRAKIFLNWMANPLLAIPGASHSKVRAAMKKPEIIPLFISVDAYMGETTALADYFVPDTTPYESWGVANIEGCCSGKSATVRWPVTEPATMKLQDGRHASFETFCVDIAKKIGLPGFGDNAISDGEGNLYPLNDAADFFLKGIANVAYADNKPVQDITSAEIKMQDLDTALGQWNESLKADEWKKAMFVISRGGRFEHSGAGFDGDNRVFIDSKCFTLYNEKFLESCHPVTGERLQYGTPIWEKASFIDGTPVHEEFSETNWPFKAVNYKAKFRSISLSANSSSLRDINPHNFIEMNVEDASALGISTGDSIKVIPAFGESFIGQALLRSGIVKGTLAVAYGYGHWEYGARSYSIEQGEMVDGDSARGTGVHLSALLDPKIDAIFGHSEAVTGGPGRSGGAYRIEKLS